jgi:hypothetical protein
MREVQRFLADPYFDTRLVVHGGWLRVEFKDLRKGDVFRLFEPNGKPDIEEDGRPQVCVALSDPEPAEGGEGVQNYGIQTVPLNWY